MISKYDIVHFNLDEIGFSNDKKEISLILPTFQRGVVWKQRRKINFIKNVKNGDPFGVLLTFKKPNGKYVLVDGLQRVSTLLKYRENPFDFINENDFFKNDYLLEKIIKLDAKLYSKKIEEESIVKLLKKIKKFILNKMKNTKDYPKMKPNPLWKLIGEAYSLNFNDNDILTIFDEYFTSLIDDLVLPYIELPAIVYKGEEENLADVFYNLNTSSVQLSKYEIHASTWGYEKTDKIKINGKDNEIVNYVLNKYKKIEKESDLEVDFKEEDLFNDGITLFEYCYSIGEILYDPKNELKVLFGDKSSTEQSAEPVGFDLLSILVGLKVNQSSFLNRKEFLGGANEVFLTKLKDIIVESSKFVADSLRYWLTEINGNVISSERNYQTYHMIYSYVANNYEIDLKNKIIKEKNNKLDNKNFSKYLFKHFIVDIINDKWDLNRQVNDLDRLIKRSEELVKYYYDIDIDMLSEDLDRWFLKMRDKGMRMSPLVDIRLFLNYLFRMKYSLDKNIDKYFKNDNENGTYFSFDIEHIVPKKRILSLNLEKYIPISATGNLCYLAIKDNRAKGSKTVYEYLDERKIATPNKEFLELINYPEPSLIKFINQSGDIFKDSYNKFLTNREIGLKKVFIELISGI
jgi:hypothetical protein